jgi:hypothetical protein
VSIAVGPSARSTYAGSVDSDPSVLEVRIVILGDKGVLCSTEGRAPLRWVIRIIFSNPHHTTSPPSNSHRQDSTRKTVRGTRVLLCKHDRDVGRLQRNGFWHEWQREWRCHPVVHLQGQSA